MAIVKLAEALLRRKELQQKVDQIKQIKDKSAIYEVRGQRHPVNTSIDEIHVDFPKLELNQVTAEYDFYAKRLRLIDGYIQSVNWSADVEVAECMDDYPRNDKI